MSIINVAFALSLTDSVRAERLAANGLPNGFVFNPSKEKIKGNTLVYTGKRFTKASPEVQFLLGVFKVTELKKIRGGQIQTSWAEDGQSWRTLV